jgi:GTPase Era involved in 16S rRNA processing
MISNPPFLKLDNDSLKSEIDSLLRQANALIGRYTSQLDPRYLGYQQQLSHQMQLVDLLELRMTIIAQMNAGKSTIMNAILGQDLLPTHDAAMTTLPTELVRNDDLHEPILTLSPQTLTEFQSIIQKLQSKLDSPEIQESTPTSDSDSTNDGYINEAIAKIKAGISISSPIQGYDQIIETLRTLNHIVRICNRIAPEINALEHLSDVPRIETPFWRSQQTERLKNQGKLVLVDTPGPNEAGASGLREVVTNQLQSSSLVLAVLDYQQLNGEATAEIKQEVQKVIDLRGKDNLYVLVNKVDQRGRNAMSSEQVREFVSTTLDIDQDDHIFEISARKAFYATNFLRELQTCPNTPVAIMPSARTLAEQTLGIDWEEELETITPEKLTAKAEKLWNQSGFAPFLEKAVGALMAQGSHRCMRAALEINNRCLAELSNDLKTL